MQLQIEAFYRGKGATYPIFGKLKVNGGSTDPLFDFLKNHPNTPGTLINAIKWNFAKFLVDRNGKAVARFSPKTTPEEIAEQLGNWL